MVSTFPCSRCPLPSAPGQSSTQAKLPTFQLQGQLDLRIHTEYTLLLSHIFYPGHQYWWGNRSFECWTHNCVFMDVGNISCPDYFMFIVIGDECLFVRIYHCLFNCLTFKKKSQIWLENKTRNTKLHFAKVLGTPVCIDNLSTFRFHRLCPVFTGQHVSSLYLTSGVVSPPPTHISTCQWPVLAKSPVTG